MSNFTEKMRVFCESKANGANNSQAAQIAGYSAATAKDQGSRLAARPDIRAEIARLKRALKNGDDGTGPKVKLFKDKYDSPLDFMLDGMNQPKLPASLRFECAKQAMPYVHARVGDGGKKQKTKDAAHDVTKRGRFAPKKAPPLPPGVSDLSKRRVANGK